MAVTKCPYCGASLELSRAVNGIITCEYCDSEVTVKTSAPERQMPPPVRGPVITGVASPELSAARKKWFKKVLTWAVIQCLTMAFVGMNIDEYQSVAVLMFVVCLLASFILPFVMAAKYPLDPNNPGKSGSKILAGFGVYGTQFMGFWFGMIIAALFEM